MSAAMMYQPATMTMAVPSNTVVETVAAPATYATGFAGTTAYAAAPTTFAAPATYAASTGFVGTQTYAAAPTYSTVAAPAVTTMAAPTYTTMAAPTYTTMAAAPTIVETMAAPQVTYAAAPQVTYAAPTVVETVAAAPVAYAAPMTTMAPSYAAPQMIQTMAPQMQVAAPVSLTQGIPNPDQITAQKTAYGAALEKQLKDGTDTISKETEIEKNMVKFTADKQLAIMQLQIEEQRNEQLALLDEQATIRQCELRKAFVERKLQLDNQSSGYIMDYEMKAIQTELAQKQYQFQQTYMTAENKLAQDYNAQISQANTGTTYSVPPAAVPAPAPKAENK